MEIKELLERICGDNYTTEWHDLNYMLIPKTIIKAHPDNEVEFNELYKLLLKSNFGHYIRTKSGGISVDKKHYYHNINKYDVKQYGQTVEIVVSVFDINKVKTYRIVWTIGNYKDNNGEECKVSGKQSALKLFNEFEKDGININDYAIDKELGKSIQDSGTIHKYNCEFYGIERRTYEHVYHIDFHKAFVSGLMLAYPEFEPAIRRFTEKSKTDKKYKTMLAAMIGWMHSVGCSYKYTQLAKDAINTFYSRFDEVLEQLKKDREVIACNTDGIWYIGPEWHGIYESEDLGGWSNDHKDVTARFKGSGAYEYIEDGKLNIVYKGSCSLDKVKSRDEWKEGDIFMPYNYGLRWMFREDIGIVWIKY